MKPTDSVPRAMPFRPPAELQAQAARLRRWSFALIFATAVFLVGAVAVIVVFKNQSNRPASLAVSEDDAPSVDSPVVPEKSAASTVPGALPKLNLSNLPGKEKKASPPTSTAKPFDARQREGFLQALGGLSAAHLYQSYLNIGLVADAVESEAYTKTDAAGLLETVGELVVLVDNHLARVAQTGLDNEDVQAIERIRTLAALLRVQTNSLLAYWATGDMDHVDRYHLAREQTWDDLKDLLGIEE